MSFSFISYVRNSYFFLKNALTWYRDAGNSSQLESVGRPFHGVDMLVS